jgi:polyisoprenoid-binding protein YceI
MTAALLLMAAAAFRIAPGHAEAGFDLKATMHTVHGRTSKVVGEVRAQDEPNGSKTLDGTIEVDAASLDTANASRDRTLHAKSLEVGRYPLLVFAPRRFVPSGPVGPDGAVPGTLSGSLTIRETTKPIAMDATLTPLDGGGYRVAGRFDVAWADFGIPDPSFLFVRIEKVAHAHFTAEFVKVEP